GGTLVSITTEEDDLVEKSSDHVLRIPDTGYDFLNALLSIIPQQLLAYYVALERGCEIDMPRNLAKSVTVE
ncbi:MAG TPA: glucosamine-fructose-6-phosphate aminotransferase, partial [Fimbriimonadaceae bacterium]|nr:glucosamine-fructose-6-phosphate aminotransferase [Fimbriimonadaceae bacterium]